jgi:MSHA pilin protein MshA
MSKQRGFTLIELVLVIVILGILAAFAVPRFVNLAGEAREAAVNALAGSLRAAGALARSISLATGAGANSTISMEGANVTMVNFYPAGTVAGIGTALADTSGYTSSYSAGTATFRPATGGSATCQVTYTQAAVNGVPTVTPTITGC